MNAKFKSVVYAMVLAVAVAPLSSYAVYKPAYMNEENKQLVATVEGELKQNAAAISEHCSDPDNEYGLAKEHQEVMNDQKKIATKPMDINNIFDMAKQGGCFAALQDFPDLSMSIPSLTSIFDSLKDTLMKYAVRKVCNAVNDALSEMLDPVSEAMDKLSESGNLDLSGRVNRDLTKRLYDIDPELGRVSKGGIPDREIEFKW